MTDSSFSSLSASCWIRRMMNLKPLTGASRMSSSMNMARPSGGPFAAFELEADVDEVVGRPRAGVFEGELALVLGGDLLDLRVELLLAVALDEEGGVHDHLVADGLVGARGDRRVAEVGVDLADVGVRLLGERRLDQAAELHPREVGRARPARGYLLLEVAYLLALLFEFG